MKQSQEMLKQILAKHVLRITDEVWGDLRALQTQLDEDIGEIDDLAEEIQDLETKVDGLLEMIDVDRKRIDLLNRHILKMHNNVLVELGLK